MNGNIDYLISALDLHLQRGLPPADAWARAVEDYAKVYHCDDGRTELTRAAEIALNYLHQGGMIFTVGRTDVYEPYLRDDPDAAKLGRGQDHEGNYYAGGAVWKTRDAAQIYLDKTGLKNVFSIYGVMVDWETQTEPEPGQEWHRLLVTSKLVKRAKRIEELTKRVAHKTAQAKRERDPVRAARLAVEVAKLETEIAKLKTGNN